MKRLIKQYCVMVLLLMTLCGSAWSMPVEAGVNSDPDCNPYINPYYYPYCYPFADYPNYNSDTDNPRHQVRAATRSDTMNHGHHHHQ